MVIYVSVAHGSPGWSCDDVAEAGTKGEVREGGSEGGRKGGRDADVSRPGQSRDDEPLGCV